MACLIAPLSTTLNDLQCVAAENPSYAPETQLRPEWPEKLSHLIRKFWRNGYTQPLNFRTQVLHSWLPNNCLPDTLNFNPTQRFLATPLFFAMSGLLSGLWYDSFVGAASGSISAARTTSSDAYRCGCTHHHYVFTAHASESTSFERLVIAR